MRQKNKEDQTHSSFFCLTFFCPVGFGGRNDDPGPKFEDLLSDALEAGVTHVQGIEFRTTELRKHRDRARSLALKAAQEKAELLADGAGRKIGKAISIG